jgi:hypothetical protein
VHGAGEIEKQETELGSEEANVSQWGDDAVG